MAGFFDGEGCISISKSSHGYSLLCDVIQCNRWVLELFKMSFGGAIRLRRQYTGNYPTYAWHICAKNAQVFLETIKPFLVLKRAEAEVAIKFQRRKGGVGCHISDGQKAVEEAEYLLLQNLKREVKQQ